jgi:hypothetical protein
VIVELIERGHDEERLWKSTPRELVGRLGFSDRRRKRETGAQLALQATAARGDPKDVKKRIRELTKE